MELDNQNISTVTIYGTPTPAQNIPVNFTISTYPAGATGQELTIISTRTNPNGQAITRLRLGNIPAEYGVTATCSDCVPEFSSVTFTCCGKLHTDEFRQGDNRWGDIQLGNHPPHYFLSLTESGDFWCCFPMERVVFSKKRSANFFPYFILLSTLFY